MFNINQGGLKMKKQMLLIIILMNMFLTATAAGGSIISSPDACFKKCAKMIDSDTCLELCDSYSHLVGRYENTNYDGPYPYQKAWVQIFMGQWGDLQLHFNIACGSKLIPKTFEIYRTSPSAGTLGLINEGSGQCETGKNPAYTFSENKIYIKANPDNDHVPGFDGIYILTKKLPILDSNQ